MKKILMLTAAAFVMTAPAAFAEDPAKPAVERPHRGGGMLEKLDTNQDGDVSKEEFMAFHEARFGELDANGDGKISKAEGDSKRAEMQKKMKERHDRKKERAAEEPAEAPVEAPVENSAE